MGSFSMYHWIILIILIGTVFGVFIAVKKISSGSVKIIGDGWEKEIKIGFTKRFYFSLFVH
jgi:hypothetical protein